MLIGITSFRGAAPRFDARQLPPSAAQVALNTNFDAATLGPIRTPRLAHTLGAPAQSFYKDGSTWIGFPGLVDVARGPVAQDRLYYTTGLNPKMLVAGIEYDLALPAPVGAPTVTNLSAPGPNPESVLFAYTWVTGFGEESPPSPPSAAIDYTAGVVQRVTTFDATPAGRNITHRRIYRTQTTITGATEYFFAAEIPVATTTYDYDAVATPLAEAIRSRDYDPPPSGLLGLVSMPNGMMAAFTGKELYFCEPFIPHAWPEKYVLTVDSAIVGLAVFGSTVAVMTTAAPYVVQGLHPEQMAMERVESGMPCLAAQGIVDFGFSALYPSSEGIILIGEGQRTNLTEGIFSRDQWLALSPATINAARFEQKYIFQHNISEFDLLEGGAPDGWGLDTPDDYDGSGPVLAGSPSSYLTYDFGTPFSSFGDQTMSWIDTRTGELGLVQSDIATPIFLYSDDTTNSLYFLDADGVSIYEWAAPNQPASLATWRSKVFNTNAPMNAAVVYVQTATTLDESDILKCRVIASGNLLREVTRANSMERLPAKGMYRAWEVEIETNVDVVAVYIGESIDDILQVLK